LLVPSLSGLVLAEATVGAVVGVAVEVVSGIAAVLAGEVAADSLIVVADEEEAVVDAVAVPRGGAV
jgi:hypothetical protein